MIPVVVGAKISLTKAPHGVAPAVKKTFINRNCRCFFRTAHSERMNNAGTSAESDPGLLEPALHWSARFIFNHTGCKRFWPKRKIVACLNRASDKFDVAS